MSDLMTRQEVCDLLGIKLVTLDSHQRRGTMPEPDQYYSRTPLWLRSTITTWARTRRGPGFPKKEETK